MPSSLLYPRSGSTVIAFWPSRLVQIQNLQLFQLVNKGEL